MRRHVIGTLMAAVAAGAAALAVVGPGVAAPAAARPAAGAKATATTSQAGYVALGRTFRFVTTTVQVPPKASYDHYAEVVLGGASVTPATLGVRAGGGAGSVEWNVVGPLGGMAGGTMNVAPKVGDWLTLSIYYNQQGRDYFTVANLTRHVTTTLVLPAPAHVVYTAAEVACLLPGHATAPHADVRLWAFTQSHVTTYNGVRGTMLGPWTTRQIVDVAAGRVVMSPSWLWNSGNNFGAWLRAA